MFYAIQTFVIVLFISSVDNVNKCDMVSDGCVNLNNSDQVKNVSTFDDRVAWKWPTVTCFW
jgi:hypothetical protein